MTLTSQSLPFLKDLYMLKVNAIERKDEQAIAYLKEKYPELFSAQFLLDMLKNIFDNAGLSNKHNISFKPNLTKIH